MIKARARGLQLVMDQIRLDRSQRKGGQLDLRLTTHEEKKLKEFEEENNLELKCTGKYFRPWTSRLHYSYMYGHAHAYICICAVN